MLSFEVLFMLYSCGLSVVCKGQTIFVFGNTGWPKKAAPFGHLAEYHPLASDHCSLLRIAVSPGTLLEAAALCPECVQRQPRERVAGKSVPGAQS